MSDAQVKKLFADVKDLKTSIGLLDSAWRMVKEDMKATDRANQHSFTRLIENQKNLETKVKEAPREAPMPEIKLCNHCNTYARMVVWNWGGWHVQCSCGKAGPKYGREIGESAAKRMAIIEWNQIN
jgi:hypothetical protein